MTRPLLSTILSTTTGEFSGRFFQRFGQPMATNTYSDRVNIIKYVKLDEGWRFAPLAGNRTVTFAGIWS